MAVVDLVKADLGVFCKHKENEQSGWGGLAFYEFAAD